MKSINRRFIKAAGGQQAVGDDCDSWENVEKLVLPQIDHHAAHLLLTSEEICFFDFSIRNSVRFQFIERKQRGACAFQGKTIRRTVPLLDMSNQKCLLVNKLYCR